MRLKRYIPIIAAMILLGIFLAIPSIQGCQGDARCFTGEVLEIVDGHTIKVVVDDQEIQLALVSTADIYEDKGVLAKAYLQKMCPPNSQVLVDEDDGQTKAGHNRIIALVRCQGVILNQEILDAGHAVLSSEFCAVSEFADSDWAIRHGC